MKTNENLLVGVVMGSFLPSPKKTELIDVIRNTVVQLETQQKRIEELEGQLKSAVHDLGVASECWNCKRNNKCHPNSPVSGPDVCCGIYQWRGATGNRVGGKWIRPEEQLPEPPREV